MKTNLGKTAKKKATILTVVQVRATIRVQRTASFPNIVGVSPSCGFSVKCLVIKVVLARCKPIQVMTNSVVCPLGRACKLHRIDSYDSNQILIFSGFSRSTRFSHFCTAQISKFQRKTVQFFAGMKMKFHFPFSFFDEFRDFSAKI